MLFYGAILLFVFFLCVRCSTCRNVFIQRLVSSVLICASVGSFLAFVILLIGTHEEEVETKTIPIVSFYYHGYTYTEERTKTHYDGYASHTHTYIVTDEKEDYVYHYATNDGGYKQGSIPSKNTTIYEEDNCEKASIIVYTTYKKSNYISDSDLANFLCFLTADGSCFRKLGTRYEIHVPKGTVIRN